MSDDGLRAQTARAVPTAAAARATAVAAAIGSGQVGRWWRAQTVRDRRLLLLGGAVLLAYITWAALLQPALSTLRQAGAESERLQLQMQTMQRLAAEAQQLRAQAPVNSVQSGAALQAATERLGESAQLALQGDRAVLTVQGLSPAQLRDWLAEARSGARARPVQAQLTRGDSGYSGNVVVAFGDGL